MSRTSCSSLPRHHGLSPQVPCTFSSHRGNPFYAPRDLTSTISNDGGRSSSHKGPISNAILLSQTNVSLAVLRLSDSQRLYLHSDRSLPSMSFHLQHCLHPLTSSPLANDAWKRDTCVLTEPTGLGGRVNVSSDANMRTEHCASSVGWLQRALAFRESTGTELDRGERGKRGGTAVVYLAFTQPGEMPDGRTVAVAAAPHDTRTDRLHSSLLPRSPTDLADLPPRTSTNVTSSEAYRLPTFGVSTGWGQQTTMHGYLITQPRSSNVSTLS